MRKRVAIYGAGYLGKQVLYHVLTYFGDDVHVLGFLDDTMDEGEPVLEGLRTLGSLEDACVSSSLHPGEIGLVFAIGYSSMRARRSAFEHVIAKGYELLSVIHPKAIVERTAEPGAGSIVLAGAILDQHVTLGPACFVDIGVRLGAGTVVGTNNYFSSGTSTGSRVRIGDNVFVGMDCTITTDVRLGSNLFINAKTLVPRDVGDALKLVELHKTRELPHR